MDNVFNLYSAALTAGWVGVFLLMKQLTPKPCAFSTDDPKVKEKETMDYYSNWPAFVHAVIISVLSKSVKNNSLQAQYVSFTKCQWRRTGPSTSSRTSP